jgi:hypothetical protein
MLTINFRLLSHEVVPNFVYPQKIGIYAGVSDVKINQSYLWEKELIENPPLRLERELISMPRENYKLIIHSARDLANADLLGKSDPFVRVFWNGRCIGITATIDDTLDPVWNEVFILSCAPGQTLDRCVLELDLFDRDNLSGECFVVVDIVLICDIFVIWF